MDNDFVYLETFRHLKEAEFNECYYRARASTLLWWDQCVRVCTTVLSGGAVASLLGSTPDVAKLLAVGTLFAATASSALGLADRARTRRELAAKWSLLSGTLHELDLRARMGQVTHKELAVAIRREGELQGEDIEPRHDRTAARAFDAVERRWGGPSTPHQPEAKSA